MNLLSWIAFGLITGLATSFLDRSKTPSSILGSVTLGILGALLGGMLGGIISGNSLTGFNVSSLLLAAVGALTLVIVSKTARNI